MQESRESVVSEMMAKMMLMLLMLMMIEDDEVEIATSPLQWVSPDLQATAEHEPVAQ